MDTARTETNNALEGKTMAKKSRYQMTNRGRKGKPSWYVEDFMGIEDQQVGKYLYSNSSRQIAEGFLKQCREQEKA